MANFAFLGALLVYRLISSTTATPHRPARHLGPSPLSDGALLLRRLHGVALSAPVRRRALSLAARHLWLAGLVSVAAALCRSGGVFLILPFVALLWDRHRRDWRGYWPGIIPAFFPVLGPAIFASILDREQWNWNAFIDVQEQWNRYSAMPWETLRCAVATCHLLGGEPDGVSWRWWTDLWRTRPGPPSPARLAPGVANSDVLELVVTVLFLVLAVVGLKMLPLYQTVWVCRA